MQSASEPADVSLVGFQGCGSVWSGIVLREGNTTEPTKESSILHAGNSQKLIYSLWNERVKFSSKSAFPVLF